MPTTIHEIHGTVPANELPDRGREANQVGVGYIPYTSLTKGEMELALLLEQTQIYAAAYPDFPEYRQASNMLQNALRGGVSRGVSFVGSLHNPVLQQVARNIDQASKKTRAASKNGLLGRKSIADGIKGIGEPIVFNFDHDCVQYATKAANRKYREQLGKDYSWQWWENNVNDSAHRRYYREQKSICKTKIDIEKIVNDRITGASHHVVYYGIKDGYPAIKGSEVATKRLLHIGGIGALANATETDSSLMSIWSETSILRKNTQVNVGAVGSLVSSFNLAPDVEGYLESYNLWAKSSIYKNPKRDKIGEPLTMAAVTALIGAIGAAVKNAADFQRSLNEKRAGAMAGAHAYGTTSFQALQTDFPDNPPAAYSGTNNTLLLLGAAAAGIYLLND